MNITDIEDKIIKNAAERKETIYEFVKPYEKAFFEDIAKLNIKKATKYPKATKHIKEMINMIKILLKKGLAYEASGGVYYNISKFKSYGKLSRISKKNMLIRARSTDDEYSKQEARDFVLWKTKKESEPFWDAPFGEGRPGWHIECSAMSIKYLGQTFDIHAGAVDLIFPHHENEIAQSEGATGKPFARFFMEGEHLLADGEKMSKSLGNVYTLRDIEKRGENPLAFRYLVLTAHYRTKLNFTFESLYAAQNSLNKIYAFVKNLLTLKPKTKKSENIKKFKDEFKKAISDDLNTPKAIAVMWRLINDCNKNPKNFNPKDVLNILYEFDKIFSINLKKIKIEKPPKEVKILVKERERHRKNKEWKKADEARERLKKIGWTAEDMSDGTKIIKS